MKFENAQNIAVVRTDKLGDMVLTLPLVKAIKSNFPDKTVSVIAQSYCKPLLMNTEYIDKCFYIDEFDNGIKEIFRLEKFDAAFFPRPVFDEVLAAFTSGIKLRIGSAYRAYSILFNHKVRDHRKVSKFHEAQYNVRMLESITGEKYKTELIRPMIDDIASQKIQNLLQNSQDKVKIIIHPGSGGSARDLPIEKLIDGLEAFANVTKFQFIITGIASESKICDDVHQNLAQSLNFCGKLNLEEMIALIEFSDGMIANSTGVLHIAASLGKRIIGFYPNSPHISQKRWGPYGTESVIINPPIDKNTQLSDDMSKIDSKKITEAVNKLFGKD
ncbi:MAG: glycosyltransferase family 9 protein [Candidatus Kapabacteria bacterium]|nr:glycosyltransferase family 9 protein [Candidatus Kapabacteria bacterium]